MAKLPFGKNFMHVKNSTEGTSNELSFSVLDAKKNSSEDRNPNSPRTVSALGKVSLFTLPGKQTGEAASSASGFGMRARALRGMQVGQSQATLLGNSDVAQRKLRRRVWRLLNIAAVLALLGILVFVGYRTLDGVLQRKQSNEITLSEAISLLEQTDSAFVALDQAIAAPAVSDQHSYDDLLSNLAAASSLLDRSINSAEQVINAHESDQLVDVAAEVKVSAQARKELIEKGRTALVQGSAAKTATDLVERAWEVTLEASSVASEAAQLLEGESSANVAKSTELTTQAMEKFQEALGLVRQAKLAYPRADFSLFESYLEKRSAAQQNALASNAAIAAADRAAAEANSAAYNASEEEAAQIAAQLPENPAQPIIDRYEQLGGASDEAYQDARARAARADEAVRAYVEGH